MGGTNQNTDTRRRVVWDEQNLQSNAEYQRLHPVTMHIDEPKTPYVHIEDEDAEAQDRGEPLSWDPKVNALARKVKEEVAHAPPAGPVAPIAKSGRPMLHPETTTGKLEEELQEKQFKQMRKAVYADEGAKFKALLAQQCAEDEDDDEGESEERKASHKTDAPDAEQHDDDAHLTEKQRDFKEKAEMIHKKRLSEEERAAHAPITALDHARRTSDSDEAVRDH